VTGRTRKYPWHSTRRHNIEDADVRVHVQRVVHRNACPPAATVERLMPPESEG